MLDKGLPGDTRFPERDNEYIADATKRRELLDMFLSDFSARFSQYEEAAKTISECEAVLKKYDDVIGAVKVPLDIQNARNARTKEGSCLECKFLHCGLNARATHTNTHTRCP